MTLAENSFSMQESLDVFLWIPFIGQQILPVTNLSTVSLLELPLKPYFRIDLTVTNNPQNISGFGTL